MAERAEIRISLDAKQAKGEAERARRKLQANEAKVKNRLATARRQEGRARSVGGIARGARGGILGLAGSVAGAAVGRVGAIGAVGRAAGAAGAALALFEGAAEVGALGAEVAVEAIVRPIVDTLLREVLPDLIPGFVGDAVADRVELLIQQKLRTAIDEFRQLARFEALTKQLARTQVIDLAVGFQRSGDGFTAEQAFDLSGNFVRESERKSFLKRAEARRTTGAIAKAVSDAIKRGFGE